MVLLIAGLCPAVSDGMVVRMDNGELVARSDVVIYGTVEQIKAQNHLREAVVRIHTVLKGGVPVKSTLRVSFSTGIEDSPTFAVAEHVLLFLRRTAPGQYQTVGGFQGKFSFK